MCKKVYEHTNSMFQCKTVVYKGDNAYFFVVKDRDGTNYYFVDLDFVRFYPVTSYMVRIGFVHEGNMTEEDIACVFNIDLSKLGFGECRPWTNTFFSKMKEDMRAGINTRVV